MQSSATIPAHDTPRTTATARGYFSTITDKMILVSLVKPDSEMDWVLFRAYIFKIEACLK